MVPQRGPKTKKMIAKFKKRHEVFLILRKKEILVLTILN